MGDTLEDMDAQDCLDKCAEIAAWKPLRKPKFVKVKTINPDSKGLNMYLKCMKAPEAVEGSSDLKEVLAGDGTGIVVLSIRSDAQAAACKAGALVRVQNAAVKMVKGKIRVAIDQWGVLKADVDAATAEIETVDEKNNVSETEYELVSK